MTDAPETRYTRSADGGISLYLVTGGGPLVLMFVMAQLPDKDRRTSEAAVGGRLSRLRRRSVAEQVDPLGVGFMRQGSTLLFDIEEASGVCQNVEQVPPLVEVAADRIDAMAEELIEIAGLITEVGGEEDQSTRLKNRRHAF